MVDVHKPDVRSKNMRAIRYKDTKPELVIRRALHARGFRYRVHVRDLPGSPDLVLPKYRAVVFIHGCFWHGHDCNLFKLPATRTDFWITKIGKNQNNDVKVKDQLLERQWRVAVIWECAMRGRGKDIEKIVDLVEKWLRSEEKKLEIRG